MTFSTIAILDTIYVDTTYAWTHVVSHDSTVYADTALLITQVTTLDTEALYFVTHVTFTNMSDSPIHNVYYMQSIDPSDGAGGDENTFNIIGSSGYPLVAGIDDLLPHSIVALGTGDTTARVFICNSGLRPYDAPDAVWNETATDVFYSGYNDADRGIGLVYNIGDIPAGGSGGTAKLTGHSPNSKTIAYFYSFKDSVDAIAAAATVPDTSATTDTTTAVRSIKNGNTTISISPNPFRSRLTITGLSSTDHVLLYDMMGRSVGIYGNGSTFTVPDAPAGHYVLQVLDDKGSVKARQVVQKL